MTIAFDGTDGLFTRLGKIFQPVVVTLSHQATLDAELQDAIDEFSKDDMDMAAAIITNRENAQSSCANVFNYLREASRTTIIEMINDDVTLPAKTLDEALRVLVRQMLANSETIDTGSIDVTTVTADSGNTGDGTIVTTNRAAGFESFDNLQQVRAEDVEFLCVEDAQERGTPGREIFAVKGEAKIGDTRHPDWPGGTGVSTRVRVCDPSQDNGAQAGMNLLTNSDFEDFTSDAPDNWAIGVGVAGTDIDDQTSTVFRGSKCLELIGDGATLHSLSQTFDNAGGTLGKLKPLTTYLCSFRIRLSSAATGAFQVSVKNGSDTILDSTNAKAVVNVASTSDSDWDHETFSFVTGSNIADTNKVVIEFTTALSDTDSLYIDSLCIAEVVRLDPMDAGFIIVPGETDFVRNDRLVWQKTNTYGGLFQNYLDRITGIRDLGFQLPYSGSPSIADSLIS